MSQGVELRNFTAIEEESPPLGGLQPRIRPEGAREGRAVVENTQYIVVVKIELIEAR